MPILIGGKFNFGTEYIEALDCDKYYVFPDGSTFLDINRDAYANMNSIFIKDYRTDITKYVVECDDVSKLGVSIICGRNARVMTR